MQIYNAAEVYQRFICLIAYNRYANIHTYIHFVCIIASSIRISLSLSLLSLLLSLFLYFSLSLVATSRFLVFLLGCSVRFGRLFVRSIYPASESRKRERERKSDDPNISGPSTTRHCLFNSTHSSILVYIQYRERERGSHADRIQHVTPQPARDILPYSHSSSCFFLRIASLLSTLF